jgi:hypothetical protein
MAETANQTLYRQELIKTFERRQSKLEARVVTDGIASGSSYVFLVNGSGNRSAVTRGVNGRIPASANDDTQLTVTMTEWHDKPQATRFNIFAGQAGAKRRSAMQEESIGVLNRKADDIIIVDALSTATQFAGTTASTLSAEKAMHAISVVLSGNVELGPNDVTGLITPAAFAYLLQNDMVSSKDYVEMGPLPGMPLLFRWAGISWMVHTALPGAGTSSETLFVFHRNAVGLAKDRENMNVSAGYNDEDDYYYARASMFMGAKLLQNTGVCCIRHDGSAYAATA